MKKTKLEEVDNSFYRASDVAIEAGQPFKLYNPSTGDSYHVDGDPAKEYFLSPLVMEDGFGTVAVSGTYDIYVTYRDGYEQREFKKVYLDRKDSEADNNPLPFTQLIYTEERMNWDTYEPELVELLFDINGNTISTAEIQGEKWVITQQYIADFIDVIPYDEKSGEIVFSYTYEDYGENLTEYYKIKYYNLDGDNVDVFSGDLSSLPVRDPVFDKDGNFVADLNYMGILIGYTDYDEDYNEVQTTSSCRIVSGETVHFPTPDLSQMIFIDAEAGTQKLIDFGLTQPGTILLAYTPDDINFYIESVISDSYEFIPEDMTSGILKLGDKEVKYSEYGRQGAIFESTDVDLFAYMETYNVNSSVELKYPHPDKIQLAFNWEMKGGLPAVIDLGISTAGYMVIAVDIEAAYGEDCPPALAGWYQAYAMDRDPRGWQYEVVPTDATSGVFRISSLDHFGDVTTTDIPYSGYVDNSTPFMVDGEFIMMTEGNIQVTPLAKPNKVYT